MALLSSHLLPAFIGAIEALISIESDLSAGISPMGHLMSAGVFRRITNLMDQIADRVRLVSGRRCSVLLKGALTYHPVVTLVYS